MANEYRAKPLPVWLGMPTSVLMWCIVISTTILLSLIGLIFFFPVSLLIRDERRLMHGVARAWGWISLALVPIWSLKVEGLENLNRKKTYVIVGNHQSLVDILVSLASLPLQFKFISKKSILSIPFLGWHMALAGYIPLDRKSHESAKKVMAKASHYLDKGVGILFFSEGTRSLDGEIHKFKSGAFRLAADHDIEILPVVIDGTGGVLPKHNWYAKNTSCFILSVGKPVRISSQNAEDIDNAAESIRREMSERLHNLRKRYGVNL